jgi:tyrosyl-tRNA synthetase
MQLTPQLLKSALTTALNEILAPIRAEFESSKEWQDIETLAYPPEVAAVKGPKKKKDGGDPAKRAAAEAAREAKRAAAAAGVVAQPDGSVEGNAKEVEKVNVGPPGDEMVEKVEKMKVDESK